NATVAALGGTPELSPSQHPETGGASRLPLRIANGESELARQTVRRHALAAIRETRHTTGPVGASRTDIDVQTDDPGIEGKPTSDSVSQGSVVVQLNPDSDPEQR
ncbi:hypothetical protein EBR96_11025, partial [bacterium]|nr:hypothetical protein [bacterium]